MFPIPPVLLRAWPRGSFPKMALVAFLVSRALAAQESPDALGSLNQTFRSWYSAEKSRRLEHPGPVVMVKGDALIFLRQAERKEVPLIPADYHRLKAVSHIPLALEVKLGPGAGKPLAQADLRALAEYLSTLKRAMEMLNKASTTPTPTACTRQIAVASQALLETTLKDGLVRPDALRAYLRAMAPHVLAEAGDAAALELTSLDQAMQAWRKDVAPEEWQAFHAIVMGAHMAREQEIAMQYFFALTGERREGGRVIFLEGQWDEGKALDLLATHLVDGDVGRDFFGDPKRMHRDLLSDAARSWLGTHHPIK